MKMEKRIKEISKQLLEEVKEEKRVITEKNGIRITNDYSYDVIPIGMLNESDKSLLQAYFKEVLNDYYYVEKI